VAAELAVGSVLELVIAKSAAGTLRDLEDAIPALLYGVYRAYLGIEAARQELALDRHQRF
jgi:hypothetical protein